MDYSRNERGVLGWLAGGRMDGGGTRHAKTLARLARAAPFEVAGKVGALRDVDFASSNTTRTKFSFVHIIISQHPLKHEEDGDKCSNAWIMKSYFV